MSERDKKAAVILHANLKPLSIPDSLYIIGIPVHTQMMDREGMAVPLAKISSEAVAYLCDEFKEALLKKHAHCVQMQALAKDTP